MKEDWKLRENYSRRLISLFDRDLDGQFSAHEQQALFAQAFQNLSRYAYFNLVENQGTLYEIKEIQGFSAWIDQGCIHYQFFLPLNLGHQDQEWQFSVYDPTNYVCFALRYVNDPQGNAEVSYLCEVLIDWSTFNTAQPSGQRWIKLTTNHTRKEKGPQANIPPGFRPLDPELAFGREITNEDPFLRDQELFGGYEPDNPFISPGEPSASAF